MNLKKHRFQPQIINGYLKCVKALIEIQRMEELYTYNSLRYEKLKGDKQGLASLRINDQYRLEFWEIISPNDQITVELCALIDITNYYK